jgi:hypothetical protein
LVFRVVGVVCLALGAIAAGAADAGSGRPLRVGFVISSEEAFRASLRRGAELAAARFNATSTRPLQLVIREGAGQWGADGDLAGRLAIDDEVGVLISPPGALAAHQVLQVAGRTQIPVISLNGDDGVFGARIPWMVSLVPGVLEELRLLVGNGGGRGRGPGRWRVLVSSAREESELRRVLGLARERDGWEGIEMTVADVGPGGVRRLEPEPKLAAGARELVEKRFEGVVLWLDPDPAMRWAIELRRAGFAGVVGGRSWLRSPHFLLSAGEAARGFRVVTQRGAGDMGAFPAELRGLDAAGAAAYDAVGLAVSVLLRAGDKPAHQVFPLPELGSGLTGRWRFDGSGRREDELRLEAWDGSAWGGVKEGR